MKKFFGVLFAVVAIIVFVNVFKSTTHKESISEKEVVVEKKKPLTEKEIFLQDEEKRRLIEKIDSIEIILINSKSVHGKLSVKGIDDSWRISTPYKREWQSFSYEGEGDDEIKKVFELKSQLGKAYLRRIHKRDLWIDAFYGEEYYENRFIMEYGALLSPDTVNGKIFPTGTFIVSRFQNESDYENGKVFHEYLNDFNDFDTSLWESIKAVYSWPEMVNGYHLLTVQVW